MLITAACQKKKKLNQQQTSDIVTRTGTQDYSQSQQREPQENETNQSSA